MSPTKGTVMSVASCLDLDDVTTGRLAQATLRWPQWQVTEPALESIGGIRELRDWLSTADAATSDTVLVPLARMASAGHDTEDAVLAGAVLAWVLVPGATRVAQRLAGGGIAYLDQAVAAQLWIEVRTSAHLQHKVAANILLNTRAGLLDDCGLRQGRGQQLILFDPADCELCDLLPSVFLKEVERSSDELGRLLAWALARQVISAGEHALLLGLVVAIQEVGVSRSRGKPRGGILGDRVTAHVGADLGIGASTVRRRAGRLIDALAGASSGYAA